MATKSNMFVYLVECLHFFLSSCRYMGTIVGISDLDPLSWPGSKWRNLQVSRASSKCHLSVEFLSFTSTLSF